MADFLRAGLYTLVIASLTRPAVYGTWSRRRLPLPFDTARVLHEWQLESMRAEEDFLAGESIGVWPAGMPYIQALRRFLDATSYC